MAKRTRDIGASVPFDRPRLSRERGQCDRAQRREDRE